MAPIHCESVSRNLPWNPLLVDASEGFSLMFSFMLADLVRSQGENKTFSPPEKQISIIGKCCSCFKFRRSRRSMDLERLGAEFRAALDVEGCL